MFFIFSMNGSTWQHQPPPAEVNLPVSDNVLNTVYVLVGPRNAKTGDPGRMIGDFYRSEAEARMAAEGTTNEVHTGYEYASQAPSILYRDQYGRETSTTLPGLFTINIPSLGVAFGHNYR